VSGDAPAYEAYVRATGQQPETLLLSNYDVPLIGFGFAVNNSFMKAHLDAIQKFASSLFGMGSNDRLFRPMDVSQFG
jgi:NitT/TauT family transport system substrate-binding protein